MTYSEEFLAEFDALMYREGGLSSSVHDNANINGSIHTAFGVTKKYFPETFKRVVDAHNSGNIELRDAILKDFYCENFWHDEFDEMKSERIRYLAFNYSVNASIITSIKLLQSVLVYFYDMDVDIDGRMGRYTLNACNSIKYQPPLESAYSFFIGIDCFLNQFPKGTKKSIWKMLLNTPRDNDKFNILGWLKRYIS